MNGSLTVRPNPHLEMLAEERVELVEWDRSDPVVEIDVPRAGNDEEFFRGGSQLVGLLN